MRISAGNALLVAYNAAVYGWLLAPILIVIVFSFSADAAFVFPPRALSLRWFRYLAGRDEFFSAARVSLEVALVAGAASTALGLLASLALVRGRFRRKDLIEGVLMSPLALPSIITGVALLQFFALAGPADALGRLVLGHVAVCTPYAIRSISACAYGVDPSLEEASRVLGAGPWRTFRRVLLPLLSPGIVAGFLFAFVTSFDNVTVSLFLVGSNTITLPIRILTYLEWQFDPSIAAVSTVLIAITIGTVIGAEWLVGSRKRRAGLA